MGFTGFYLVLLGFTEFDWVLLSLSGFYGVWVGFCRVWLGFSGLQRGFCRFFFGFFLCLFWLVDRVGCQFHGAKLRKGPSKTEQKSRNERKNKERATISASPIGGSHRCAPPFLNQSGGTGWQGTFPWSRLSRILEQLSIRQTQRNWNVAIFFRCVRVSRVSVSSTPFSLKKRPFWTEFCFFLFFVPLKNGAGTQRHLPLKLWAKLRTVPDRFELFFFKAASKVVSTRAKRQWPDPLTKSRQNPLVKLDKIR